MMSVFDPPLPLGKAEMKFDTGVICGSISGTP